MNLYPAFGPHTNCILLKSTLDESFDDLCKAVSYIYQTGIHAIPIFVKSGKEITGNRANTLRSLKFTNNQNIVFSFDTPALPTNANSYCKIDNVEFSNDILEKCYSHAFKNKRIEVAGLLIGKKIDDIIQITDSIPVSTGSEKSVILNPVKVGKISESLHGSDNYLVGWYHSHTHTATFSSIDVRLQSAYQTTYPHCIALVIDNQQKTHTIYKVNGIRSNHRKITSLNIPSLHKSKMISDSVTITTSVINKEEIEILDLQSNSVETGSVAEFTTKIANLGTVKLKNLVLSISLTSPNGSDTFRIESTPFDLDFGKTTTIKIDKLIPQKWTTGITLVRAGIKRDKTDVWLFRGFNTSLQVSNPPFYNVKLKVLQSDQKINPSTVATYIVLVKNTGNRDDIVEVILDKTKVPKLWKVDLFDSKEYKKNRFTISLNPGETHKFQVNVTSPNIEQGGTEVPITFSAVSLKSEN